MPTIAEIASGDDRFDVLVAALAFVDAELPGTNLIATLDDAAQDLTVFAPTDTAFARLAAALGYDGAADDDTGIATFLTATLDATTLRDVILYHVAAGAKSAADIAALDTLDTLNGATIGSADLPTLVDAEPDLPDPSLILTDVAADNGIVHAIDRVLLPLDLAGNDAPTIAGIVAASGDFDGNGADFDILLAAVQAAGLVDALNDAGADLTVFAPNDAAFLGLATALGYGGSSEDGALGYLVRALTLLSGGGDPVPLLTDVLLYHVANGSLQASQIAASPAVTTLQGGTVTLNGTSLQDNDPDLPDPGLVATDIQAANGIVHVIDGVLIPADLLASDGANDVDFVIAGNAADHIVTGDDADFVDAGGRADTVALGAGRDVGLGQAGDDTILGGNGADILRGGADDDLLLGGRGNDTIDGGSGDDLIRGGQGADTFVFAAGSGDDLLIGFRDGQDRIDVSALGISRFGQIDATGSAFKTTIDFAGGNSVDILGLDIARLDASDFIFA